MKPVHDYLRICHTYCNFLGGLRWSQTDDTVEYSNGGTFAFTGEIAQFLEGFARDRLLHFAHVLHLLSFLRSSKRTDAVSEIVRLRSAYAGSHGNLQNAGTFFAQLCRHILEVPGGPDGASVCARLRDTGRPLRWHAFSATDSFSLIEFPAVEPEDFEGRILRQTQAFSDADLKHWFRHGTGPLVEAGQAVAEQLPLPRTLAGALAAALERPRLAGVRSLVPQLAGALALPRPHRLPQELPIGGYADVVTRGNVDQILPGQFALDELEFLRRYAEKELLYYHREEPHTRTRRELVVVLDQGVRTWGEVRLVLTAAVIAFGRQAVRQTMPFLLATTAHGSLVDPLEVGEELGAILDASDLSGDPGNVLAQVIEPSTGRERDVVLLTHRRNLLEGNVVAAAQKITAPARLFALTLDSPEQVELAEIRHGHAVSLRQFRVDVASLRETTAPQPPEQRMDVSPIWTGSVEPIGYPFRFGLPGPLLGNLIAFDRDGEWLVTVSQGGMLHAWKTDGSDWEILPRPMVHGCIFTAPKALVGVAGGFVLVGYNHGQIVVLHYDFARRSCRPHMLQYRGVIDLDAAHCVYMPLYHALIVDPPDDATAYCALDLATSQCFQAKLGESASRARNAWENYPSLKQIHNLTVKTRHTPCPKSGTPSYLWLDRVRGELAVHDAVHPSWRIIPRADGQPLLEGSCVLDAQCHWQILAVRVDRCATHQGPILLLFRGPPGKLLAQYPLRSAAYTYALSAQGEFLAVQTGGGAVQLFKVDEGTKPRLTVFKGGYPHRVNFFPRRHSFILNPWSNHCHIVAWEKGKLEMHYTWQNSALVWHKAGEPSTWRNHAETTRVLLDGKQKSVRWFTATGLLRYITAAHPERFVQVWEVEGIVAALDRFGQLSILDRNHNLVCMFLARRRHIGVWMPDGTRAGAPTLTGGPPTPGALERIGAALLQASAGGKTP